MRVFIGGKWLLIFVFFFGFLFSELRAAQFRIVYPQAIVDVYYCNRGKWESRGRVLTRDAFLNHLNSIRTNQYPGGYDLNDTNIPPPSPIL